MDLPWLVGGNETPPTQRTLPTARMLNAFCAFLCLLQVPMWTIDRDDDSMIAFMDYTDLDSLKANFRYHYDGNRAPMGIFLHPRRCACARVSLLLVLHAQQPSRTPAYIRLPVPAASAMWAMMRCEPLCNGLRSTSTYTL